MEPEVYQVLGGCTPSPPAPATPTRIDMPVQKVNDATTPVVKIVARKGSSSSWERETSPRYSDIYFNSTQFNTLVANVNTSNSIFVTYDAPSINGDDQIYNQKVTSHYP